MRACSLVGVSLILLIPAICEAQARDLVRMPHTAREPLVTPATADLHRLHRRLTFDTLLTVPAGATPHCRSDAPTERRFLFPLFSDRETSSSGRGSRALLPPCRPAPRPRQAR